MLASPSPFHPQMAAAMHRPDTSNPSSLNPATLVGFKPLGTDQHNQSDDREEDDMNGSDMESDVGSDSGDINDIDSDKLDASHREILEKLKRQELEEREEIERELKEAQREALIRAQRHEELRAQELRAQEDKDRAERGVDDPVTPLQTEIKMQRPLGLLAQHGLTTKSHGVDRDADREHGSTAAASAAAAAVDDDDDEKDSKDVVERTSSPTDHDGCKPADDGEKYDRDRPLPLTIPLPRPDLDFTHPAFLDSRGFSLGPSSHPNSPRSTGTPGLDGSESTGAQTPAGHHWTFEEQFKQLYELSDEPKRKEFLDDLFSFMQKRGTPVNRIPIMAKQTLDLYELFRLVVSKGGLVEVINKKLWREITKGLNLPSSITSAAFTLRTQYMKYLYPFECERLKLSNPAELQAAIDGNRREGRRPSYGYDFSPIPTMIPTPPTPHLNGGFPPHALNGRPNLSTPPKDSPTDLKMSKESSGIWNLKTWSDSPLDLKMGKENSAVWNLKTWSEDEHPMGPVHLASLAERDARAMEAAARAMEEATKRMEQASRATSITSAVTKTTTTSTPTSSKLSEPLGQPPLKRSMLDDDRFMAHLGMPSAHLKITSRGDGRSEFDNSLVVSMEINGVMYQGVLFAQHGHPRRI